jgi:hypothetical protein|tara:strand:+ start:795 stop:1001 length:207 start_codon:yes stop_codon:yes gene_type:complete
MLVLNYESKKALKECIGKLLNYSETSIFGEEYLPNGSFCGCNRPHLTGYKREFFANVTMQDGLIKSIK